MILRAADLSKSYTRGLQPVQALYPTNLTIPKGQFVSIMGPSGSGKSTLLHLFGGLDRPTSGSVEIEGQRLEKLKDHELSKFRRRRLGFVFQFFNLLPTLNALENIALPMLLDGTSLKNCEARAQTLLQEMGLEKRSHHRPAELSGGEMQRVAIARALMSEPALILADEPTGNLDSKTSQAVLELLKWTSKEKKQTLIMVTHDLRAAEFGDRIIRLQDGKIIGDESR